MDANEARVRRKAKRNGYIVRKSRRLNFHPDDHGQLMLVDSDTGFPVLGYKYDACLDDIEAWLSDE